MYNMYMYYRGTAYTVRAGSAIFGGGGLQVAAFHREGHCVEEGP